MKPLQTLLKRAKSYLTQKRKNQSIVKSTKEGALYVDAKDLFSLPKVQQLLIDMQNVKYTKFKKPCLKWYSINDYMPGNGKTVLVFTDAKIIEEAKFTYDDGWNRMTADRILFWAYYNHPYDTPSTK